MVDVLVHSPDASPSELGKLGLDTTSWERHLKPAGWEYASYAAAEGVGKIFVLVYFFHKYEGVTDFRAGHGDTLRSNRV